MTDLIASEYNSCYYIYMWNWPSDGFSSTRVHVVRGPHSKPCKPNVIILSGHVSVVDLKVMITISHSNCECFSRADK